MFIMEAAPASRRDDDERDRAPRNSVSFSSSSCIRPLKLSQKPFCIGFPGAMKCQTIWCSCAQESMAFEVNSVPLSETTMPGLPRCLVSAVLAPLNRPEFAGGRFCLNQAAMAV
jgi:hypothetical protein